ncbi:MAG: cell envelope integrity protein CreD [Pseudomonadota bacterium]
MLRNPLFIRFGTITLLTLVFLVPLSMVRGVITERDLYLQSAVYDIAASWTGPQRVVTPILVIPFTENYEETIWDKRKNTYVSVKKTRVGHKTFMPAALDVDATIATELRRRGIYSVPVYHSNFKITGRFAPPNLKTAIQSDRGELTWGQPRLVLGLADTRGIGADPRLVMQSESQSFEPGTRLASLGTGIHAPLTNIDLDQPLPFELSLAVRGSQRVHIAPIAQDASIHVTADWPHPKFNGRFLPTTREISSDGFDASWRVSAFSTDANEFLARCDINECGDFESLLLGVDLIESVDLYTRADRATKYGILFVLLTFVAFFLTETLTSKRLHPVHYTLVGATLAMFYLLLISLAEHIGFNVAYALATSACCALIGSYLTAVLASRKLAAVYAGAIAVLYGMLFLILRSEDAALLMGSLLLFMLLAIVMLSTRRIEWTETALAMRHRQRGGTADDLSPTER